ncbi:UbiH/UbiF family hydroxylase, partial [Rhodobacterales bacterium HKCCE3408]|nr:UbiH/UbiF family hydroxylase [Rhodobacterales bacterium HKCCE3408]
MSIDECDILVSGGGVAGLTAAAVLGRAGFRVVLTDPAPPVTDAADPAADLRSTAFMQPAQALLDEAGLWDGLAPHATALQTMRIVDLDSNGQPRAMHDFDAAEISDLPFAWNLPNWLIRRVLVEALAGLPNVDFRPGTGTASMLPRLTEARVTLSDGARLAARLVVAADGRGSPLRDAAGIPVRRFRYGQKALAFAVTHPIPHGNVSTEIHRSGGPFTLVPLPDRDGVPASAIVWMERGPEAERLAALPEPDFEAIMSERSGHLFGPLTLASRRSVWPIVSQLAGRMSAERLALIAEAAHVVPPIGAQGLNMSLADIAALRDLALDRPDGLGDAATLDAYHRARHAEITARVLGVDALNRASMAGSPPMAEL